MEYGVDVINAAICVPMPLRIESERWTIVASTHTAGSAHTNAVAIYFRVRLDQRLQVRAGVNAACATAFALPFLDVLANEDVNARSLAHDVANGEDVGHVGAHLDVDVDVDVDEATVGDGYAISSPLLQCQNVLYKVHYLHGN